MTIGGKKIIHPQTRTTIYTHTAIYTISNSSIPYTNNIPVSIMIFSVISFEFSNREVENNCNVHSITKFQKKQQHTASAPCFEGDQQCCLLC